VHGGLPIGFQRVARCAGDELLFRVSAQCRRATLPDERRPALAEGI
jgi:Asp-tRNA(Asn)/Glu-tRNA(Gln) amidotransferase A subunit family amidase